ncbi:MAG: hypothetical protein DME83_02800 [Verrucomicrobia bacterium]|nr:MAG: hypothetical protein DME83_02800 [Verrucomicrobiota bacterium]
MPLHPTLKVIMNDQQTLDKMRTRWRLKDKSMNNEAQSTYGLLVQSEEKGRSIMETVVYALVGLSAIVSIWQFAEQPNRLPIDGPTPEPYLAPNASHHQVGSGFKWGS